MAPRRGSQKGQRTHEKSPSCSLGFWCEGRATSGVRRLPLVGGVGALYESACAQEGVHLGDDAAGGCG